MSGFYSDRSISKDFSAKTMVVLDAVQLSGWQYVLQQTEKLGSKGKIWISTEASRK